MGRRASAAEDELEEAGCEGGDGESEDLGGVPTMISGELPVPELLL